MKQAPLINKDYLEHIKQQFLTAQQLETFLAYCAKPLRQSLRFNPKKISKADFLAIANAYQWQLTTIPWCEQGFWIDNHQSTTQLALGNLPEHLQGVFYIQEASSMLPPQALLCKHANQQQPLMLLDLAAAPGSKTTQLAELLDERAFLVANELSASRLKSLHSNLIRCGVSNFCLAHQDGVKLCQSLHEQFDYILLDAPCSGEATIRKDPAALKNWSLNKVLAMASLQKKLLLAAYHALKPGGSMVYSTCTLSHQENHQVADFLLQSSDAQIEPLHNLFKQAEKVTTKQGYLHILPQDFDSEGFFVAKFNKPFTKPHKKTLHKNKSTKKPYKPFYSPADKKSSQQLVSYYQQRFAISLPLKEYQIAQKDNLFWLIPKAFFTIDQATRFNRAGIKFAQIYSDKIRTQHEFAVCFASQATKNKLALNKSEYEIFMRGVDLSIAATDARIKTISNGEVLLSYQNQLVGFGLLLTGKIKNKLPRSLVKDNYLAD